MTKNCHTEVFRVEQRVYVERNGRVELALTPSGIIDRLSAAGVQYAREDRLRTAAQARFLQSLALAAQAIATGRACEHRHSLTTVATATVVPGRSGLLRVLIPNEPPHFTLNARTLAELLQAYYQRGVPLREDWVEQWLTEHYQLATNVPNAA